MTKGQGYIALKVNKADATKIHEIANEAGVTDLIPVDEMHMTLIYDKSNPSIDHPLSNETYDSRIHAIKELGEGKWKAVVMELLCPEISARHSHLKRLGYSHSYPDFIPHVSIKYKPEKGDLMKLKEVFNKIAEKVPSIRLGDEFRESITSS